MRNDNVKEILSASRAGSDKHIDIPSQFHHCFFMGDMNYRVTFDAAQPDASYEKTKKAYAEQKKKLIKKKSEKKGAVVKNDSNEKPVPLEEVQLLIANAEKEEEAGSNGGNR